MISSEIVPAFVLHCHPVSDMNPKLARWEAKLDSILHEIDLKLEAKYGRNWPLHPARPQSGTAANPQYDGLFRLTASFSAGYGSRLGAGYILRVEIVTLHAIPEEERATIEAAAVRMVRAGLKKEFPEHHLAVERDGPVYKIYGDLDLEKR